MEERLDQPPKLLQECCRRPAGQEPVMQLVAHSPFSAISIRHSDDQTNASRGLTAFTQELMCALYKQ